MFLFIKHIDIEGPGTMGTYLRDHGFEYDVINLGRGDKLPTNLEGFEAVVSLGGPMNVYEEDKYPFLKEETELIRQILEKNVPFLGICLGSQMLAKASGAKVVKASQKEIGFLTVQLSVDGRRDPMFKGLNENLIVFQWHEDTFYVPQGGSHLARSILCLNQAFRAGPFAYGIQFHVEITDQSIKQWSDAYMESTQGFLKQKEAMLDDYCRLKSQFDMTAYEMYHNFINLVQARKKLAL